MIQTILASLAIALLSGMGVGSGGLLVIYLTLIENAPQLTAQGINLLFFLFAAASSLLLHITRRRLFFGAILIMSATGILGSLIGSHLASLLPAAALRKIQKTAQKNAPCRKAGGRFFLFSGSHRVYFFFLRSLSATFVPSSYCT